VPIIRDGELFIISHSPEQTKRFGVRLGGLLQAGDVVCLSGAMGAGKTLLSRGIGEGWGSQHPITSPTFNLVHEHTRADGGRLYHMDCYRLQDAADADSVGFDDMVDSGAILLLEWPERIYDALPPERLWIDLKVTDDTRRNLMFEAHGDRYKALIEQFRVQTLGRGAS
jgi:tRNA threonylcarbamoyladenosine biosynthesis protein TsaE